MVGEHEIVVRETRREADGVLSLLLGEPDGGQLPAWDPGAHIDLVLGEQLARQYSLCGRRADPRVWQVAVLREPQSRGGSATVHDHVRPGQRLRTRGPRNSFPLVEARDHLLIAGGIGVTPLLSMAEALHERGASWRMLYGGRRRTSMAFVDRLLSLAVDRLTVWPEDELGLPDVAGWLGPPRERTAIYCCGPEPLVHAVEVLCSAWPEGALHVERFRGISPLAPEGGQSSFEVIAASTGVTVRVHEGQSIAQALEEHGIYVPISCGEGTCGTCETAVLEGVPEHRDVVLTEEELQSNTKMMVCCSRARTSRLVLDI
jgi:ferredoxin-NADP reductase